MNITLTNIGKRYRFEWIFKKVNLSFQLGKKYALLGHNGSGKSTLMKVISGNLTPSKGKVIYQHLDKNIDLDSIYGYMSYAAPYIELIEELSLKESIEFHQKFKPFMNGLTTQDILDILKLPTKSNKELRYFSSGMKQRLRLALAICSDSPILLLDEPTTNLDTQGVNWYRDLIKKYTSNKLVIIASNVEVDYDFCDETIEVTKFK